MLESIKTWLDFAIVGFGLLAAAAAVFSLLIGGRLDDAKKIEEQKLKAQVASSSAQAETAKSEAAKALESAATMNERANSLELEAEKQKERAAIAEKELLELKQRIRPRLITTDQEREIRDGLKGIPKGSVNVSSPLGNSEASAYAAQILELLKEAGWKTSTGIGLSTITGEGLFIIIPDKNDANAGNLQKVFGQSGINIQGQVDAKFPKDPITLFVGDKH